MTDIDKKNLKCIDCKYCWECDSPNYLECFCGKKDIMILSSDKSCEEIEVGKIDDNFDLPF